jgi:hypothetical protein
MFKIKLDKVVPKLNQLDTYIDSEVESFVVSDDEIRDDGNNFKIYVFILVLKKNKVHVYFQFSRLNYSRRNRKRRQVQRGHIETNQS